MALSFSDISANFCTIFVITVGMFAIIWINRPIICVKTKLTGFAKIAGVDFEIAYAKSRIF